MSQSKLQVRSFSILSCSLFILPFLSSLFLPSFQERNSLSFEDKETVLEVVVSSDEARADTGLDVREGQEIYFEATGQISLQRGNPKADCGPDGYPLQTMQQPFPHRNIGALIGEVAWLISVEIDEKSGEEFRYEIAEKFYLGAQNQVRMPLSGRLFLGINENVVGDNSGEYRVRVYLNKNSIQ